MTADEYETLLGLILLTLLVVVVIAGFIVVVVSLWKGSRNDDA